MGFELAGRPSRCLLHRPSTLEDEQRSQNGSMRKSVSIRPMGVAEEQRRQPLQPAEVDLAAVIDAVEVDGQPAIEPDERVAFEELDRAAQVGQLEPVAASASRRSPIDRRSVSTTRSSSSSTSLSRARRSAALAGVSPTESRAATNRGRSVCRSLLGFVQSDLQQFARRCAFCVGHAHGGQSPQGKAQVFHSEHERLVG